MYDSLALEPTGRQPKRLLPAPCDVQLGRQNLGHQWRTGEKLAEDTVHGPKCANVSVLKPDQAKTLIRFATQRQASVAGWGANGGPPGGMFNQPMGLSGGFDANMLLQSHLMQVSGT